MGEYADAYFRQEVMEQHGFDPGSMYGDDTPKRKKKPSPNVKCPKCGKWLKSAQGVRDHLRDYHGMSQDSKGEV